MYNLQTEKIIMTNPISPRIFFSVSTKIWITVFAGLLILFGGLTIVRHVHPSDRDLAATGLLADMIVTFPLVYYFMIIVPLKQRKWNILFVVTCCSAVAYFVLPPHQKQQILQLRKGLFIIELAGLLYLLFKIRQIKTSFNLMQAEFPDFPANLQKSIGKVISSQFVARLIAMELTILRFGLLCWKKTAGVPERFEPVRFSIYRESGYSALFGVFLSVCIIEITGFHLLLVHYHLQTIAWIISGLSIYGTLFLVSDLSAIIKLPVVITNDRIILRAGLRWRAVTSMDNIASVEKINDNYEAPENCFKGGIMKANANLLITFKLPVTLERIYRKPAAFSQLVLNIDQPENFIAAHSEYTKQLTV